MNRNNLIIKIRNVLDLNLYEAKVYLAVIAYAPIKRNDVFKRADIPQSRIYDIIVNLKNKGLINSFKKNKDEYYQALDPKNSINAYLTSLKWKQGEDMEIKRIEFENKINNLKKRFYEEFKKKEIIAEELEVLLKNIYSKDIPIEEELVMIIKGEPNLVNHIAEQVKLSRNVIKNLSTPPYLPEALIWENISNKLKKGLTYYHLAYNGLILEWGLWRIKEDKKIGVNFRFLAKSYIQEKFYIFDENVCFVRLKDPLTDSFSELGIFFRDRNFVNDYIKKFDELWKKAMSFDKIKKLIIKKKNVLSKELNKDEFIILNKILERGKYANIHDLKIKDVKEVLNNLSKKNLIIPFEKAVIGHIANIKIFLGREHEF